MQSETELEHAPKATQYLASVRTLNEAIAAATRAIARDDLASLVGQIEIQQECCGRLLALNSQRPALRADPAAWAPIADELRTLATRSRVFAALLAYSGRSNRILLALSNMYGELLSRATGASALSCEG